MVFLATTREAYDLNCESLGENGGHMIRTEFTSDLQDLDLFLEPRIRFVSYYLVLFKDILLLRT